MTQRINKLRQQLEAKGLQAILISQANNRHYISGFSGSAGFLILSATQAILATDFRYILQANQEAPAFEIVEVKGSVWKWLAKLATDFNIRQLGFESSDIAFATYRKTADSLKKAESQLELVPTEGIVESIRMIKEESEVICLEKSAQLADAAIEFIASIVHPGMSEKEAAWEAEKFLRESGSAILPFDIIVASGPNSALPHAKPTERIINTGEPILVDLGAKVDGYCSDISRTFCLGTIDDTFAKTYDLVLGAQLTAQATLAKGMTGEEADKLARTVIEEGGHGGNFGHGLGHGIGLAGHEGPRLAQDSQNIIDNNMVFTIEPGIYIEGWGGIRIEDTFILEPSGPRALTKAIKVK